MATPWMQSFTLLHRFLLPAACLLWGFQAHAGLVAYFAFDETSGTTAADPNGYTGTLTNMTGTEWTTGKVGGALNFDGTNDYVNLGSIASTDSLALAGSTFTLAAWVYSTGSGMPYQRIVDKADGSYGQNGYAFSVTPSGRLYLWVNQTGGDSAFRTTSSEVSSNTWAHVAATGDGSVYRFYVNGSEVAGEFLASGSYKAPASATTNMAIGAWSSTLERNFGGSIDELRIYNSALSASEVSALASGGAPEPAETFALLGLVVAAGLGFREWRSRRKAKAA